MEQIEAITNELKDTLSAKVDESVKSVRKETEELAVKMTDELSSVKKTVSDLIASGSKTVENKLYKAMDDSLSTKGKEVEVAHRHFSDSLAAPAFASPAGAYRLRDSYEYHLIYDIMEKVYVNETGGVFNLPNATAEWKGIGEAIVTPNTKDQSPRSYTLGRLQSLETIPFDYKVFGIENLNLAGFSQMDNKIRKAMSDAVLNGVTVNGNTVKGLKDTTNDVTVASQNEVVTAILAAVDMYGPTSRVVVSPEVFKGLDFMNTAAANSVLLSLVGGGITPEQITRAFLPAGVYAYVFAGNKSVVAEKNSIVLRSFEDMGQLYMGAFYYGIPSVDVASVTAIKHA